MYPSGTLSGHLRLISRLEASLPEEETTECTPYQRLNGRVALITGCDSSMARSVARTFAQEGASVAFVYQNEEEAARATERAIQNHGKRGLSVRSDLASAEACSQAVARVVEKFGKLDIIVNHPVSQALRKLPLHDLEKHITESFQTNVLSLFHLTAAALPHLRKSDQPCIINTAALPAFTDEMGSLTCATTQGAIMSFTRALSDQLKADEIRVNAIAPLDLGSDRLTDEGAECYVFLASDEAAYMKGQILYPHGERVITPLLH